MTTISPTQLSLRKLRDEGYIADVVEYYQAMGLPSHVKERKAWEAGKAGLSLPHYPGPPGVHKDLWGWCDIVAYHQDRPETMAFVQTTTAHNLSARVRKIMDWPLIRPLAEHHEVLVHGWQQPGGKGTRWQCRVHRVTAEAFVEPF